MEPLLRRRLRVVGLLVFGLTAFLPVHGCGPTPRDFNPGARGVSGPGEERRVDALDAVQVPLKEIGAAFAEGARAGSPALAVRRVKAWYPYLLLPLWLGLLAWGRLGRGSGAVRAGRAALVLACGIAAFEAWYLARAFKGTGLLPRAWRWPEVGVAWLGVCAVLFARRAGRGRSELGACLSAQALLGALHGVMFVLGDALDWLRDGHGLVPTGRALVATYLPAFWLAVGALLAAAAPGYLRLPPPRPRGP